MKLRSIMALFGLLLAFTVLTPANAGPSSLGDEINFEQVELEDVTILSNDLISLDYVADMAAFDKSANGKTTAVVLSDELIAEKQDRPPITSTNNKTLKESNMQITSLYWHTGHNK